MDNYRGTIQRFSRENGVRIVVIEPNEILKLFSRAQQLIWLLFRRRENENTETEIKPR